MRLSETRTVHWDFHYDKAMLFSACRRWYYITLSLHWFQRLPFAPIKFNSTLRTFRSCFRTCLTPLLWSHIHSHTHLFGFSNMAISCGCPALSIWIFTVIYTSHLSDASSPWVISPLSVSPLRLFSPSQLVSRQSCHCPFPPPWDDAGWHHRLHRDASLQSSWLSWADSSFPYDFKRSGGSSDLQQLSRIPLLRRCWWAQPSGHDPFPCLVCNKTPHSSILSLGLPSTSSLP